MGQAFVLDASLTLAWAFEDEFDADARAVLRAFESGEAFVPAVWALEVGNGLLGAERRDRLTWADGVRFVALLQQLPIRVETNGAERLLGEVLELARTQGLSTYDAAYLDLAMRLGLPLASRDRKLVEAAIRCGVSIFRPAS